MPDRPENIVPDEVAGDLESLVEGRGPFMEAEEAGLKREEDINRPDESDPQLQDDIDARQATVESRLAALEQSLAVGLPSVEVPVLFPDQNVEFGKTTAAFTSGATITLDPCDVDGNDTGEANVSVYVQADRTSAVVDIANAAIMQWERFDTRETGGVAGTLVASHGGLSQAWIDNGRGPMAKVSSHVFTFDIQANNAWQDVVTTVDFSNNYLLGVAYYDGGAPIVNGSPNQSAVQWFDIEASDFTANAPSHPGHIYKTGNTEPKDLLQVNYALFGDFNLRVGADGGLEARVENFLLQFSVTVWLLASGNLPQASAIVLD